MPPLPLPNPISSSRRWSIGDRFSADHLNDAPDAFNALINALASVQDSGTTPIQVERWPGIISNKGPNGEADFTDERYWVQRAFIQGAKPNDQITIQQEVAPSGSSSTTPSGVGFDQNASNIFVVTNLADLQYHSHSLTKGLFVWVTAYWDSGLTSVPASTVPGAAGTPADNQKHYVIDLNRGSFPVTLSAGAGSSGTNSPPAAASRTYTVTDAESGVQMGTGIGMWMARQKGHVSDATKGTARYISGTLYIMECDEVYDTTTC